MTTTTITFFLATKKKALAVTTIAFFTIAQPKAKKEGDNSCRKAAVAFFVATKVEKEGEGGSLPSSSYSRSRFKLPLGSRFKFLPGSRFKHSRALSWLSFQLLPNSGDGVSAKSKLGEVGRRGEVGGREVSRREKLWGREEAEKTNNSGQGRMCFCSSSK